MKILHIDQNHPVLWSELSVLGYENTEAYALDRVQILSIIGDFQGVVIRSRILIDQEFLDAAKQLKFIARVGAGLDAIHTDYAAEKNVTLINAPEGNSNAVGEHALGLLLNLLNNINRADRQLRQGFWRREANRGVELSGHTVGIIGYGHMGKAFAKTLRGFDCPVICYDIEPGVGDENARQVSLEDFFAQAQVVSLHTPLTSLTEYMVNTDFINQFDHDIYLINTARGRSVVTQDLVQALARGKVLGAGLDVLEYEHSSFENLLTQNPPQALEALLNLDNVILSPHIAGWTHQSKEKLARVIVAKIQDHFPLS
jgi:D-3-phosphoglycerate dehydrogenase